MAPRSSIPGGNDPATARPRQTDLVASLGHDTYLVETKWESSPAEIGDVVNGSRPDHETRVDATKDGELKLSIGQGVDMGRPSLLLTRVKKQNGAVISVHVGGGCVQMMEGTFRLAGEG